MLLALSGVPAGALAQVPGDAAVQAQWFTGSLEAPSPALPKAGLLAIEPYLVYQDNTGYYDDGGSHHASQDDARQVDSITVFKYGISDRLSIEALPTFVHVWQDQSRVTGVADLPVELEYRFNDENNKTGFPSVTAAAGITFPAGHYDHLSTPLEGLGTGAYTGKLGILLQSLFAGPGDHPVRLRFYGAAFEPLGGVTVRGISVYGTGAGFRGTVKPGFAAEMGIGAGYGIDRRWVLALDLVQSFANSSHLHGINENAQFVSTTSSSTAQTSVAPALEYNFSGRVGVIAGVECSVAGRNSAAFVAPQIALSMVF